MLFLSNLSGLSSTSDSENFEDFTDCGPTATSISSICNPSGSCWTVGEPSYLWPGTVNFRKPTASEESIIATALNNACNTGRKVKSVNLNA